MTSGFEATPAEIEKRRVLMICRSSSSTTGDRRKSGHKLPDVQRQETVLRKWLSRNITGPLDVSGVKAVNDVISLDVLADALQTRNCELVVVTSLDRIARGRSIFRFLELAAALKTRVVAVCDGIDTAKPMWQCALMLAGACHK